jgi:3-phenylpropionate/trans-cinnamate dioxygenase ferredoxin subunit
MVTQFIKVCSETEIEEGKTRLFLVNEQPVIVARYNGQIYAIEGICSHDGGEFGDNETLIDSQIECPRHGARFDIQTGEAKRLPAVAGIKSYEIKVDDGQVFVAADQ